MGQSITQAIQVLQIYGYHVSVIRDTLLAQHSDGVDHLLRVENAEVDHLDVQKLVDRENRRRVEIEDKLRDKTVLESYHK